MNRISKIDTRAEVFAVEACILAGGRSSRMGRDKARLRLGRRTLLGHVRATARECGLPTRVIRRDQVRRCGPLGGIFTALATSPAEAVLVLSCDMPFVSAELLRRFMAGFSRRKSALFVHENGVAGFPILIRRASLPVIERQLAAEEFSMQSLARVLRAQIFRPRRGQADELFNINTPEDIARAAKYLREQDPTRQIPQRSPHRRRRPCLSGAPISCKVRAC